MTSSQVVTTNPPISDRCRILHKKCQLPPQLTDSVPYCGDYARFNDLRGSYQAAEDLTRVIVEA